MNIRLKQRFSHVLIQLFAIYNVAISVYAQVPAASYPERPVKIVVPFAPGAGTDAMGRLMAQKL